MSHKKKDFDKLEKGRYSRDTLREVVRHVLNERTTTKQASKDHSIPLRTIQHHVKCVSQFILY